MLYKFATDELNLILVEPIKKTKNKIGKMED